MQDLSEYHSEIVSKLKGLEKFLDSASMPRTPFEIRYFVAGQHQHPMKQFRQLLIELQVADYAVRGCIIGQKKRLARKQILEGEIKKLEAQRTYHNDTIELTILNGKINEKKAEAEELDLAKEQEDRAFMGKIKEIEVMYHMLKNEFGDWLDKNEEEQLLSDGEYWTLRMARQASNDIASHGRLSVGMVSAIKQLPTEQVRKVLELAYTEDLNLNKEISNAKNEALKHLSSSSEFNHEIGKLPEPNFYPVKYRKDASVGYPDDRIIDCDQIDIVIGMVQKDTSVKAITEELEYPVGKNCIWIKEECPDESLVGDYKYRLALHAESLNASHLLILDDDIEADKNILRILISHNKDIVGAWYPRRLSPPDSSSILIENGRKTGVKIGNGLIEIDWALASGCTLYNMECLKKLERPWFRTTDKCTDDTYLTLLARSYGIKSYLDRDTRVIHVDRATGKKYKVEDIK